MSSFSFFQMFGKLLFWTFMSSVPDAPASTVIGRALDSKEEISVVKRMTRGMLDNVREMMDTGGLKSKI